jgi:hypothetical protein
MHWRQCIHGTHWGFVQTELPELNFSRDSFQRMMQILNMKLKNRGQMKVNEPKKP